MRSRTAITLPLLLLTLLLGGAVYLPQSGWTAPYAPAPDSSPQPEKSIKEIVETTPRLSVLNRILEASGMKDSLRSGGPYTMFLPVNEAFYELPYAERSRLWDTSNRKMIRRVLYNHIINRKMISSEIAQRTNVPSRLEDLPVDTTGTLLMVKGANVIQADVEATNGVVHVVDKILMPSYMD